MKVLCYFTEPQVPTVGRGSHFKTMNWSWWKAQSEAWITLEMTLPLTFELYTRPLCIPNCKSAVWCLRQLKSSEVVPTISILLLFLLYSHCTTLLQSGAGRSHQPNNEHRHKKYQGKQRCLVLKAERQTKLCNHRESRRITSTELPMRYFLSDLISD